MDSISQWVCQSGLRLNAAKTRFVLFSRQRHPLSTSLTLDGSPIPQVSSVKYLGVILSKDLTWNDHINSVCLMPSVGWVFCTGSFILRVLLVSTNSANPLFSQPWTIFQVSEIPARHFIMINWSLYRALPLKLLRNSGTLPRLLNLPRLSTRRTRQKLSLCYRIVTGRSIIPPRFFTPHLSHLRHNHHLPLYYPSFKTFHKSSSFFSQCCSTLELSPS